MGAAIARLDDVAMDEVHLTTPVSDEAIRSLKLGDVVYLSGALYTAREGVYRQVVDKGVAFPDAVRALTNVNFHCSPAAATRAGRHPRGRGGDGDRELPLRQVHGPVVRALGRARHRGQGRAHRAGLSRVVRPPRRGLPHHGGLRHGRGLRARDHAACARSTGSASWASPRRSGSSRSSRLGPFLVEGDAEGRSLFALANREINVRIAEVYKTLPPPALARFGEVLSRTDEVV